MAHETRFGVKEGHNWQEPLPCSQLPGTAAALDPRGPLLTPAWGGQAECRAWRGLSKVSPCQGQEPCTISSF